MMKTEEMRFSAYEDACLHAQLWMPDEAPRAVVQIVHGMTEHIGRYEALAQALTAHGIAVAGYDLRGHGQNKGDPRIASLGEGGWDSSLMDMQLFARLLSQRFAAIPRIWLGFSLGSFLLREYLNRCEDDAAGVILMGTGDQPGLVLSILAAIIKGQIAKASFDGTTPLVRKLSFGTYNQKFAPNRTPSDWLCADAAQLDAYLSDPLCRRDISAGLFYQLLCAMKRTGSPAAYRGWRKDMPVLLVSGGNDPVGDFGKGVVHVETAMKAAGMENVQLQLFHGVRHDLLHEEDTGSAAQARMLLEQWIEQNCL